MMEKGLKWRDIFLALLGTILSFADPITDILTLVEFSRADHKKWFTVGLVFIVFPCSLYFLVHCTLNLYKNSFSIKLILTRAFLFGFYPFCPALVKLKMLISDLKKPWRSNEIQHFDNETSGEEEDDIHVRRDDSRYFLLFETAFESAPQFIIQLYVMAVQQESVMIVQIISLPVSFLSLARASVVADEVFHYDDRTNDGLNMKNRLLHFATHLLLLSSRLFAAALVTASYNTGLWAFFFFAFYYIPLLICDLVWLLGRDCEGEIHLKSLVYVFLFHWLRDDTSLRILRVSAQNRNKDVRRMMLLSNVLFVIENISMILLFYFSPFPHTWYSLPVTIYVCLVTVLGAVMRLTHFYFFTKESDD